MSTYNVNLTLENIRTITIMFLDIFIMWMLLYNTIKLVQANSKTVRIFKGVLLILLADAVATMIGLKTVAYVTNIFINWGFLAFIIIFQQEIRSLMLHESGLTALIGVCLGIPPGIALVGIILKTCEFDNMVFASYVSIKSVLLASVITFVFAVLIEWLLTRKVRSIDMVEALKSVE